MNDIQISFSKNADVKCQKEMPDLQALAGISGIVEIRMEGDGQAYNALILVKPDLTAIKAGLTDIGIDTGIFKFTRSTGLVVSGFTAHPPHHDRDEQLQRAYVEAAASPAAWADFHSRFLDVDDDTYRANASAFHAERAS